MYTPGFNRVTDRATLLEAMRASSFAVLVGPVAGVSGVDATHLPVVVKDEGEHGVIEGHFAKANRHWEALAGCETLVIFSGPHSYVSPAFYTDPLSVPTWNYIAVHARGSLEVVEQDEAKNNLVLDLIGLHEPGFQDRWQQMPEGFRRSMLHGIVGFRIPITRIEGKFKISQNRNDAERRSVRAAHAAGTADQQSLAAWMARFEALNQ